MQTRSSRHLAVSSLLLTLQVLPGCLWQADLPGKAPLRQGMKDIEAGRTTRDEVRSLLGQPWYTSAAWHAELHLGSSESLNAVVAGLVPVAAWHEQDPATLLVVFDPSGVVSGVAYFGRGKADCSHLCEVGHLQGLDIADLHILLAPEALQRQSPASRHRADECLLLIEGSREDFGVARPGLYLDQRFVQRLPPSGQAYFRLAVGPGAHTLSCVTEWSDALFGPAYDAVPRPRHDLAPPRGARIEHLPVSCSAGETRVLRLVNSGGRWMGRARCSIEVTDAVPDLLHAREVVVPDGP